MTTLNVMIFFFLILPNNQKPQPDKAKNNIESQRKPAKLHCKFREQAQSSGVLLPLQCQTPKQLSHLSLSVNTGIQTGEAAKR